MDKYLHYQKLIEECYLRQNKLFREVPKAALKRDLRLIDEYLDVVTDTFSADGLQEDDEPNEYGLVLEEIIDYLLKFRYALVD